MIVNEVRLAAIWGALLMLTIPMSIANYVNRRGDSARWYHMAGCVPCARMEPEIDALIEDGYAIEKVELFKLPADLSMVPTTKILRDGVEIMRLVGYRDRAAVAEHLIKKD